VLVNHRLVDPDTGAVVGELPHREEGDFAYPVKGQPGRFHFENAIVDVASRRVIAIQDPDVRFGDRTLERVGPGGEVLWSMPAGDEEMGSQWRHLAFAGERVFAGTGNELRALDHETGKVLWRAPCAVGALLAIGGNVLTVEYGADTIRPVVGRDGATGKELFRTPLPRGLQPQLARAGDLAAVVGDELTWFLDARGVPRIKLDEGLLGIVPTPPPSPGWLLATTKRLARLDGAGKAVWEHPPIRDTFVSVAHFETLAGGDVLVVGYGAIADSGVEVIRLSPSDGHEVWHTRCAPLGVVHSEYYHAAYLEVRGDRGVVVSQGSSGNWVETLRLDDGRSIRRFVLPDR
jgi:outer membrane protein assembly factor BamB